MKAVILAGGLGTRISEETGTIPKPMINIGNKPILWHIMKIYSFYGINDFIICCGYNGYVIKEYFANYFLHMSDIKLDLNKNEITVLNKSSEDWSVTLVDTGEHTMTGGRLKKVEKYLKDEDYFCFTYGDGLANVNIKDVIKFHNEQNTLATLTATYSPGRFGSLELIDNKVSTFKEKPKSSRVIVNGGFFVLSPKVFEFIDDFNTSWEKEPLEKLAVLGELAAYRHEGFWQPMDTLNDKNILEDLWRSKNAPWKVW
jgi:glucose-1-phosphate cytidylyltransferase